MIDVKDATCFPLTVVTGGECRMGPRRDFLEFCFSSMCLLIYKSGVQVAIHGSDESNWMDATLTAALHLFAKERDIGGTIIHGPISLLQRHLRLPYSRALLVREQLRVRGILVPAGPNTHEWRIADAHATEENMVD